MTCLVKQLLVDEMITILFFSFPFSSPQPYPVTHPSIAWKPHDTSSLSPSQRDNAFAGLLDPFLAPLSGLLGFTTDALLGRGAHLVWPPRHGHPHERF
jgi:hypothetical protein